VNDWKRACDGVEEALEHAQSLTLPSGNFLVWDDPCPRHVMIRWMPVPSLTKCQIVMLTHCTWDLPGDKCMVSRFENVIDVTSPDPYSSQYV
jgi:hypothetical protein